MVDTLPPGATGSAVTGEQISTVHGACKAESCGLCSFSSRIALLMHRSWRSYGVGEYEASRESVLLLQRQGLF
jgi:hypothetical protein